MPVMEGVCTSGHFEPMAQASDSKFGVLSFVLSQ